MGPVKTRVRVVSLRSFDPLIAALSPKAYRAWGRSLEWSCFHGRDGMLTPEDLRVIGAGPAATKELLERGVWKLDEDGSTFVAELREGSVVAEVEGGEVEHDRPMTAAERAKAYRARKRDGASRNGVTECDAKRDDSHVTNQRDVTQERDVTAVTGGPTGGSDPISSPDPESYSALTSSSEDLTGSARDSGKRAKRQVKRPYPLNFPLPEELELLLKYGREKGLRDGQTREQIEALELWAKGSGAMKLDWMATAKGWLRRYAAGDGFGGNGNGRPAAPPPAPYHAPIDTKPRDPGLAPADALAAIAKAKAAVLGRTMP